MTISFQGYITGFSKTWLMKMSAFFSQKPGFNHSNKPYNRTKEEWQWIERRRKRDWHRFNFFIDNFWTNKKMEKSINMVEFSWDAFSEIQIDIGNIGKTWQRHFNKVVICSIIEYFCLLIFFGKLKVSIFIRNGCFVSKL